MDLGAGRRPPRRSLAPGSTRLDPLAGTLRRRRDSPRPGESALAGGCLRPRPVGLRVFSVAGRTTATLPLALTRVGGADLLGKDTWLLR